jgi:hypothetical protein
VEATEATPVLLEYLDVIDVREFGISMPIRNKINVPAIEINVPLTS